MTRRKVFVGAVALLISMLASTLIASGLSSTAYASSDYSTIYKKTFLGNLGWCYVNNAFRSSVQLKDYENKGVAALMTHAGQREVWSLQTGMVRDMDWYKIYVPNGLNSGTISCQEMLTGKKEALVGSGGSLASGSLFDLFGKSGQPAITTFGYTVDSGTDGTGTGCVSFKYTYVDDNSQLQNATTNRLCMPIKDDKIVIKRISDYDSNIDLDSQSGLQGQLYIKPDVNNWYVVQVRTTNIYLMTMGSLIGDVSADGVKWSDFVSNFSTAVLNAFGAESMYCDTWHYCINSSTNLYFEYDSTGDYSNATLTDSGGASSKILQYLTGSSNFQTYWYNDDDKYFLYDQYVRDAVNKNSGLYYGTCGTDKNAIATANKDDGASRGYAVRSGDQWCGLRGVEGVSTKYNGISGSSRLSPMDFKDIVYGLMEEVDYAAIEAGGTTIGSIGDNNTGNSGNNSSNTTTAGDTSAVALCYEGSGALGWVLCPVLKVVGDATSKLYDFIEGALQIQANDIMARNGAVYTAWSSFRNFANILFAIAFAVIILAQLTGIGISNYNVKKILPRLIMVAALVNISFILCQIAVDISNLVGYSAKALFDNLAGGSSATVSMGSVIGSIVSIVGIGGTVTLVTGVAVTAATIGYWILPLVVSLIGMLIGVLFFFLTLGARQAGIIIMVILSPLAIVCYALPNTKSFYDRWQKIFTALLVVYPICGLLIGGGNYAGIIMMNAATSMGGDQDLLKMLYTIVGMLMTVVPFFFIPSLLRNSMNAIGGLGAKISNFGNGFRSGVTRGIRGSRAFQEHQAEEQRRLNYERDQTRVGRLNRRAEGKGIIGRGRAALAGLGLPVSTGLSSHEKVRAAVAQSNIDKATDATAQALRARYESDGTANNIGDINDDNNDPNSLVSRYLAASQRLFSDPTDRDALEEQKAASMLLASSKPGRSQLRQANERLGSQIAGMDADHKRTASQVMQRTANNLLRTNSGDIAKSPLLDEQITGMQDINNDYTNMRQKTLENSIQKLNARTMSDMHTSDLRAYLDAMQGEDPLIKPGSKLARTLSRVASDTLSDPRYQGQIKADALPFINQLANSGYTRAGDTDQAVSAISSADSAELSRIHNDIKSGNMDASDSAAVMSAMGHALMRSMDPNDSLNLSTAQASQMSKILSDGRYDLSSIAGEYGVDSSTLQDKLDVATGLKISHEPQQTLGDRHPTWQRATAAQAAASSGKIAEGDWIDTTTNRKLRQQDAAEASVLEARDMEAQKRMAEEKVRRDDEAYRRSQTPIPMPPPGGSS